MGESSDSLAPQKTKPCPSSAANDTKPPLKLVDRTKTYAWTEAVKLLKQIPATKGDQTVDLAFKLGVDPKQSDQMVRGTVALPAGSGKNVRVLVFAKGGCR